MKDMPSRVGSPMLSGRFWRATLTAKRSSMSDNPRCSSLSSTRNRPGCNMGWLSMHAAWAGRGRASASSMTIWVVLAPPLKAAPASNAWLPRLASVMLAWCLVRGFAPRPLVSRLVSVAGDLRAGWHADRRQRRRLRPGLLQRPPAARSQGHDERVWTAYHARPAQSGALEQGRVYPSGGSRLAGIACSPDSKGAF